VVEDAQKMVNYLQGNFGLKPSSRGEHPDRKYII